MKPSSESSATAKGWAASSEGDGVEQDPMALADQPPRADLFDPVPAIGFKADVQLVAALARIGPVVERMGGIGRIEQQNARGVAAAQQHRGESQADDQRLQGSVLSDSSHIEGFGALEEPAPSGHHHRIADKLAP
jgi:hypothetical protein